MRVRDTYDRLTGEAHKVIVGQDQVLGELVTALLAGGHALIVGVPGLAKTLLVSTIARTLALDFARVQFTPDLMPSDLTGTELIDEDKTTGARSLRFSKGPVFANVVLADEINRTPPRTQAALLEAMQERQVTAGGVQHALPVPFFVLATQNPIEQEGTYPLPEAQLDRFMFNIRIAYPNEAEELDVVRQTTGLPRTGVKPVLTATEVIELQALVRTVPVAEHVMRYALRIARATRVRANGEGIDAVAKYVAWGAGPRASQYLVLGAKVRALLTGSSHVTPDHVRFVAAPVLRHRIITNFNAEADGVTTDDIVNTLLEAVPVEAAGAQARRLDEVLE